MIERRTLPVALLADGSCLGVPIITLTGRSPGPHLVCTAGIHSDEPQAMRALMELAGELDPAAITGALVLVPVANPPAFGAVTRTSPLDGMDLNRIFPGRRDGTASERLAHTLFEQVLRSADFVLALHSWFRSGEVLPYVEYGHAIAATAGRSLAAARDGSLRERIVLDRPGLLAAVRRAPNLQPGGHVARLFTDFSGREVP